MISRFPRMMMRLGPVFCTGLWLAVPGITLAQSASLHTSFDVHVASGLVQQPNARSPLQRGDVFLHSARIGLPLHWQWKHVTLQSTVWLGQAKVNDQRSTYALGSFTVAAQRGKWRTSVGVEQNIGVSSTIQVATTMHGDTLITIDTMRTSRSELLRAFDVVGTVGWDFGGSFVRMLAGVPTATQHKPWVGIDGSIAVGSASAVVVSARRQSTRTTFRAPAVSVGVRTSLWRARTGVPVKASGAALGVQGTVVRTEIRGDTVIVSLRLSPNIQHAAIAGDATHWEPVAMVRDANGWWFASLCMPDRISRLQLRLDHGEWSSIPGLPETRNEYGGMVSLLHATAQTP